MWNGLEARSAPPRPLFERRRPLVVGQPAVGLIDRIGLLSYVVRTVIGGLLCRAICKARLTATRTRPSHALRRPGVWHASDGDAETVCDASRSNCGKQKSTSYLDAGSSHPLAALIRLLCGKLYMACLISCSRDARQAKRGQRVTRHSMGR
jgi:hypothetical protein